MTSVGLSGGEANPYPEAGYEACVTWQHLGGYFDGDGIVGVGVVKYVLRFNCRELKLGHIRLGRKFGYSVHVIHRILGAP